MTVTFTWYTDLELTAALPKAVGENAPKVTVAPSAGMRQLAAPLTLPATVEVTVYALEDGGVRASNVSAVLDPAGNHGWTGASWSLFNKPGRFDLTMSGGTGRFRGGLLTTCPKCQSPWAVASQQAWSDDTDCPDCGYHYAYMIGD